MSSSVVLGCVCDIVLTQGIARLASVSTAIPSSCGGGVPSVTRKGQGGVSLNVGTTKVVQLSIRNLSEG